MNLRTKVALVLGALLLATAPAMAVADQPAEPGNGHGKGPQAKAYGVLCKDQSKKHVKGQKGTPFSQCVTAMAKAAHNESLSPGQACKGMSKEHVKGEKGTPFSRCVTAAAKLQKEQREQS